MTSEEERLGIREVLRAHLADPALELVPLLSRGRSRTYRAESEGRRWFVKFPDEGARMYPLLRAGAACPHLVKSAFDAPVPFAGGFVTCLDWSPAETVPPEKWTDGQLESFVAAYASFSKVLNRTTDVGAPEDDAAFFATISGYARRHPCVAWLLKPILDLPEDERTYRPGESLVVTHGDMHSGNYGFVGDRLAFFYDVDNILRGYATDDLAYTVLDRAQRLSVRGRGFTRCVEVLDRLMAHFGGSPREWRVGINRKRIRQAARKIAKRPDSVIPAIDIARHDRRAVMLMRQVRLLPFGSGEKDG